MIQNIIAEQKRISSANLEMFLYQVFGSCGGVIAGCCYCLVIVFDGYGMQNMIILSLYSETPVTLS